MGSQRDLRIPTSGSWTHGVRYGSEEALRHPIATVR
jgi:hypothetical protein